MENKGAATKDHVPVRDFVGKFLLLGLYALAGHTNTKMGKRKVVRTREGSVVNRLLRATTNYPDVVWPIFAVPRANNSRDMTEWGATLFWDEYESFPTHDILASLIRSEALHEPVFQTKILAQEDPKRDRRSLTGRRLKKLAGKDKGTESALSFDEWRACLKSILVPATVCHWLGLPPLNDSSGNVTVKQDGSIPYLHERKGSHEFYSLFAGSVLRHAGALNVTLERTTLTRDGMPDYRWDELPDSLDWTPGDPLVTRVRPKRLIRVARMFGFGCDMGEDASLDAFDNMIRNSGADLRVKAWDAFAGPRHFNGKLYYGDTLTEFAEAYSNLVASVIAEENGQPPGTERAGIFGQFYVGRNSKSEPRFLVDTRRGNSLRTETRQDGGVRKATDPSRFSLEAQFGNVGNQDANGVELHIESGQEGIVLFNYCPRHFDDEDNSIVFPTTRLELVPLRGPAIEFDQDSWKLGSLPTLDGGEVRFGPVANGQIRLVRNGSLPWDGRSKTFADLEPLVTVARAERGSAFDAVLSASVNSNMRLEQQSERPEPGEVLDAALKALRIRCKSDGDNRLILKTLRVNVVGELADESVDSGLETR